MKARTSPVWTALLTGADRAEAMSLVHDTARDMLRCTPVQPVVAANEAVLLGYLARLHSDEDARRRMHERLDLAADLLVRVPVSAGLYAGVCGVGWAVAHLERIGLLSAEEGEDANEEIDAGLVASLENVPWRGDYDLISGLTGSAVYALERLPRGRARKCLQEVVARLGETAMVTVDGTTWLREARWLGPGTREVHPEGWFDVGMAHGVPGVVSALARIGGAGIAAKQSGDLVAEALRWMRAQRIPAGDRPSLYPAAVRPGQGPLPSRTAWCYGDPGVALAFLAAGRHLHEPAWEAEARDIGLACVARTAEQCGIDDMGLCHGAVGLGHVFARLHHSLGDEEFADAARRWWRIGLGMRRPGQGIGGVFTLEDAAGTGAARWQSSSHFLNGAVGVALSLLGAATSCEPEWDRLLLADV